MAALLNAPADFAAESLAGFASARSDLVHPVDGGVVRADAAGASRVAVVMGGGSGHFPAFAGWVGPGFGTAAACGGIFASPSEAQVLRVARSADRGAGVLFVPINYAGDILHFTAAAERLRAAGVDARLVAVTDDIASGGPADRSSRRGIAGSFTVLKLVGAAAESGRSLDAVEAVAVAANDATRSFGVAFSGCTLPGADHPLYTVPEGRMAVGLGIHGEPGLWEVDLGSARAVADLLVDGLFDERSPEPGRSVALVVNGLGATKYDELHLVFARVRERLADAGMPVVAPVVGEVMTSLDMAGVSVSLTYLDPELEALWLRPAHTAAFTRGAVVPRTAPLGAEVGADAFALGGTTSRVDAPRPDDPVVAPGSPASHAAADTLLDALARIRAALAEGEAGLGELDAVAGDGDHGSGMLRGAAAAEFAAARAVAAGAGAGTVLAVAGDAWSDAGGGTSGALWGAGLVAAGALVGDDAAPDAEATASAVRAFVDAIVRRGGAAAGDKTMLDAALPFAIELDRALESGAGIGDAWSSAAAVSGEAAQATADITARKGRSRIHGSRSLGTPDPGAVSFALIVRSAAAAAS